MNATRKIPRRESQAALRARVSDIIIHLGDTYPEATCALRHENPWQLLVATILSAQCTDKRVNMVTPGLFAHYPTMQAFAEAKLEDLEEAVKTTGFYRNKARNIQGSARLILENFGGQVPQTMQGLLTLPGVARKTANVVLGAAFDIADGVVVDTHVARITQRLGLSRENAPTKIEQDLMRILPEGEWIDFSHLLIFHGRSLCSARKPLCAECPVQELCPSAEKYLSA